VCTLYFWYLRAFVMQPFGCNIIYKVEFTVDKRLLLDFTTPEGWKAELTYVVGYIPRRLKPDHRQSLIQVLPGLT